MFEGTLRTAQELPGSWWAAWFLLAFAFGMLQRIQPNHRSWMKWAWTDPRLMVSELADHRLQVSWVVANQLAGVAFSLACSGLFSMLTVEQISWWAVLRVFLMWNLLIALRWLVSQLWAIHAGDSLKGEVFLLHHRIVMESAAWMIAPVGFVCTAWGMEASRVGVGCALGIWLAGWAIRQSRALRQNPVFRKQPVLGILYLCGLEILPVAVLFRTWQG